MCPICGVLNRDGEDVSAQVHSMMSTLYHVSSAEAWLVFNRTPRRWDRDTESLTRSATAAQALGQVSFATKEQPVERPSFDCSEKLAVLYEGNLHNSQELRSHLTMNHKLSTGSAAEITAHLLEERYRGDLGVSLKQVAQILDGAYCLAVSDASQVILMRDPAGLRPAFYAENGQVMAFASRKTALWQIGLRNVKPLRAGMLVSFGEGGITLEEACSLRKMGVKVVIDDLTTAVDSYCALLRVAVEKRLHNLKKVGVLVSGGVDSCLIAKLVSDIAAERGIEVTAYTAGVYGAADIEYAEHFAQELGLSHKVRRLHQDEVESYISQVALAVEERDLVQVEASIGVYAAVEMASHDGLKVIFSGQGADELWGGYSWYPQVIAKEGYKGLQQRMWGDLQRVDIETLDRENRIVLAHGLEEVFPYVDTEIIKLAMSVSPRLKITSAQDTVGKHLQREASKRLGLPAKYADRNKDAAQHGTGIHDVLDAIARKNGFTPELVVRAGYNSEEVSQVKLASSTRYGYLYAEKELWQTPEHVQFFLDSVAYENSLLNEGERSRIGQFLTRARITK